MIVIKEKHKQVNYQTAADKKLNNVVKLCANYEITHHFKTNLWLENSTYFPANPQDFSKECRYKCELFKSKFATSSVMKDWTECDRCTNLNETRKISNTNNEQFEH